MARNNNRSVLRVATKPNTAGSRSISVTNSELLFRLNVGPAEQRANILINPGKFPWSTLISNCFDMYYPTGIGFTWVPDCPTTTSGQVVMFIDYDPEDDNENLNFDKLAAMSGAKTASIYQNCALSYVAANTVLASHKYLCSPEVTPNRLADCGRLWVRTRGGMTSTEISGGSVYVHYTIKMFNPQSCPTLYPPTARFSLKDGGAGNGTASNPIGSLDRNTVTATEQAVINSVYVNTRNWVISKVAGLFLPSDLDVGFHADVVRHPDCTEYNDSDVAIAAGPKMSLYPASVAAVYVTDAPQLYLSGTIAYTYTAATAVDTPSLNLVLGSEWKIVTKTLLNEYSNGVPASKVGVSTLIHQKFSAHLQRTTPGEHLWAQFIITGTSSAGIVNASISDVMVSAYPLDRTLPKYAY